MLIQDTYHSLGNIVMGIDNYNGVIMKIDGHPNASVTMCICVLSIQFQ